jgi:hypothetical protein
MPVASICDRPAGSGPGGSQVLELDEAKRRRTLLRIDGGGGSVNDINWALAQGYEVHAKDYAAHRVWELVGGVSEWRDDPHVAGRQVGWVIEPSSACAGPSHASRSVAGGPIANGPWV